MKWLSILFARTTHIHPHPHSNSKPALHLLCLVFACSWKCIVPKSLLSWPLSAESFGQSRAKQAQPKHGVSVPSWRLLLISVLLLCLSQRWIVPMVWLQYKVLPAHSRSALRTQELVWPFKAASPALSCICRASLIPEVHKCNTDEVLWGLGCSKCRTIIVNAKLTLWKFKQRHNLEC